jgi:peptide/nickel transport system substrate-binding protein
MKRCIGLAAFSLVVLLASVPAPAEAAPEGQLTLALHFSLAPAWFDPADTSGIITPFWILYALHDALVNPSAWQPR